MDTPATGGFIPKTAAKDVLAAFLLKDKKSSYEYLQLLHSYVIEINENTEARVAYLERTITPELEKVKRTSVAVPQPPANPFKNSDFLNASKNNNKILAIISMYSIAKLYGDLNLLSQLAFGIVIYLAFEKASSPMNKIYAFASTKIEEFPNFLENIVAFFTKEYQLSTFVKPLTNRRIIVPTIIALSIHLYNPELVTNNVFNPIMGFMTTYGLDGFGQKILDSYVSYLIGTLLAMGITNSLFNSINNWINSLPESKSL